jgi:hypothetical protein
MRETPKYPNQLAATDYQRRRKDLAVLEVDNGIIVFVLRRFHFLSTSTVGERNRNRGRVLLAVVEL